MNKFLMFFTVFVTSMVVRIMPSLAQGNSLAFDGTTQYAQVVNPTYREQTSPLRHGLKPQAHLVLLKLLDMEVQHQLMK
jgi:hypothetical protein